MNADERETVINATDTDDVVRIWTAQRKYIGALRRHPSFTQTRTGHHDSTEWAEFTIPADEWNPTRGARIHRQPRSDEQRAAQTARILAAASERAAARATNNPAPV